MIEFIKEYYDFLTTPLLIYWVGKITFFIVRKIWALILIRIYSKMDADKVRLIDGSNAIKDNYKDNVILEKPNPVNLNKIG